MNHASLLTLLALISVITYLRVAHLTWAKETRNILLNDPDKYSESPPTRRETPPKGSMRRPCGASTRNFVKNKHKSTP